MQPDHFYTTAGKWRIPVYKSGLCVVGSGAAAWNGAHTAKIESPSTKVVLVTEGVHMGTSRNTGSDKQTYYKQSTTAMHPDSPYEMARDYMAGGAMHGDIALTEACGSLAGFYKLVALGVPFPHDRYGEYPGYRTDHDEKSRATSLGPLTSRQMTEALEQAARDSGVTVFDGYRAVQLLTKPCGDANDGGFHNEVCGVVCISLREVCANDPAGIAVFLAPSVLWAVGGPSALYHRSVYPESQTCALGTALAAGASGVNMTEFQYGLASLSFRWNVSGSYQQVIPRYVSTAADGVSDMREFLLDVFPDTKTLSHAVFRKGYEWPFSPAKLSSWADFGTDTFPGGSFSSYVDIAVHRENQRGRRVFLDFRQNSTGVARSGTVTAEEVGAEAFTYLDNCHATTGTPIQRLRHMNEKAYQLYLDHGIDLERDMLEIGVCAQHMNGGLEGDIWYESPTLPRLFIVGEANGVFGVQRPGGSALNSTQVSSRRAAEKAVHVYTDPVSTLTDDMLADTFFLADRLYDSKNANPSIPVLSAKDIRALRTAWGERMDRCGGFLRDMEAIEQLRNDTQEALRMADTLFVEDVPALIEFQIHLDTMLTRLAVLSSMVAYAETGGLSRGSYLLLEDGDIPTHVTVDMAHQKKVEQVLVCRSLHGLHVTCAWQDVRPIPTEEHWFEEVYNRHGTRDSYTEK